MILEEKRPTEKKSGKLTMEDRRILTLSGVEDVGEFSEKSVLLDTTLGRMLIRGDALHISKIDTENGNFALDGKIDSIQYMKKSQKKGRFFENLFK